MSLHSSTSNKKEIGAEDGSFSATRLNTGAIRENVDVRIQKSVDFPYEAANSTHDSGMK